MAEKLSESAAPAESGTFPAGGAEIASSLQERALREARTRHLPIPDDLSALSVEDARRLLMVRNYDEAVHALVNLSELDPTSHLVRANLEQLRKLGYPK